MGLRAVIYTPEQLTDIRSTDSFADYVFRREAVAACDILLFLFLYCFAPIQVTVEWDSLFFWPRSLFPKFWKSLYQICDCVIHT